MIMLERGLSFEKIQEVIKQSIELFPEQGIIGSWLLVYIIVCVAAAVFSYPRYHKKSFGIFIISLFVTVTLVYSNELCHSKSLLGIHTLAYTIYGIWYSIFFALFYWITIGILYLCRQDNILNKKTRFVILFLSIAIICFTAQIWYGVLTTFIFLTAALL